MMIIFVQQNEKFCLKKIGGDYRSQMQYKRKSTVYRYSRNTTTVFTWRFCMFLNINLLRLYTYKWTM